MWSEKQVSPFERKLKSKPSMEVEAVGKTATGKAR